VYIALFFTYGYSLKTWNASGILEKELEIYTELNKCYGISFKFVTYGNNEDINLVSEYDFIEVIPIYEYISFTNSKIINYMKSFIIPFKIKNSIQEVSVIKQHQLLGSWVSILSKYVAKKPLIVRTGYDMFLFSINEKKSLLIRFLYWLLTFITLKNADLYTLSSNSDYEALNKYFSMSKVSIRKNWIKYIVEPKHLESRKNKKILAVGRLESQKNYSFMINSLEGGDFSLDIVGEGSLKDNIFNLAKEKNVEVDFLGSYKNEILLEKYQEYKYFLQTSLYEGNPKTILEAMSAGCIVIANNIKNNKELIRDNISGILFTDNKDILLNLNNLEKKLERSEDISKEAVKFIRENYLLEELVKKEYYDYKSLIA